MLNQEASADARIGYTGKHHNNDTGLSYMNSRYYHAELGRFDRMDPVGPLSGGIDYLNRYAYVINNPYKYVDPTGMTVDATKPDRLPDMRVPAGIEPKWVTQCESVGRGDKALIYLSRYLYRGVVNEHNLLSLKDDQVSFRYQDNRSKRWHIVTLLALKFLWRVLKHVLPKPE